MRKADAMLQFKATLIKPSLESVDIASQFFSAPLPLHPFTSSPVALSPRTLRVK